MQVKLYRKPLVLNYGQTYLSGTHMGNLDKSEKIASPLDSQ